MAKLIKVTGWVHPPSCSLLVDPVLGRLQFGPGSAGVNAKTVCRFPYDTKSLFEMSSSGTVVVRNQLTVSMGMGPWAGDVGNASGTYVLACGGNRKVNEAYHMVKGALEALDSLYNVASPLTTAGFSAFTPNAEIGPVKVDVAAIGRDLSFAAGAAEAMSLLRDAMKGTVGQPKEDPTQTHAGIMIAEVNLVIPSEPFSFSFSLYEVVKNGEKYWLTAEQVNDGLAAANAAAAAYMGSLSSFMQGIRLGSKPSQLIASSNPRLGVRPPATQAEELDDANRALFDAWWDSVGSLHAGFTDAYMDQEFRKAHDAYRLANPGSDLTYEEWLEQYKLLAKGSQPPDTGSSSWWDWVSDTVGSVGSAIVDVAKDWGPIGTLAGVAGVTDVVKGETNYIPWIVAGGVALLLLAD